MNGRYTNHYHEGQMTVRLNCRISQRYTPKTHFQKHTRKTSRVIMNKIC